jgi:hypothetical protein
MKITVTLDPDVAAALRNFENKRVTSKRQFINQVLRRGFKDMNGKPKPRKRFQTQAVDMGRCLIGDIDNVTDAIAIAEGEAFK